MPLFHTNSFCHYWCKLPSNIQDTVLLWLSDFHHILQSLISQYSYLKSGLWSWLPNSLYFYNYIIGIVLVIRFFYVFCFSRVLYRDCSYLLPFSTLLTSVRAYNTAEILLLHPWTPVGFSSVFSLKLLRKLYFMFEFCFL